MSDPDLDAQLCFPLYAVSRAVSRRYADLLADTGLTYPQYLTMLALWGESPMTVGKIGQRLRLDSGTLTPLLKRLEATGLVARHRDPDDERRVIVEPTDAGWALRESTAKLPTQILDAISLTETELGQLHRIVTKILDRIG
jgi:DNA-binding MarR family transcriptional regulator